MMSVPGLDFTWSYDRNEAARLSAQGNCADMIRSWPWGETPLGPIEHWDQSLISALNFMLGTRFPMFLTWGAQNHIFYNDAYEPALSGKSNVLGRPLQSVFPEAWPQLGPLVRRALKGEAVYLEDFSVPLYRDGQVSETWWSFCYSPILSSRSVIMGLLGVVLETTQRVLTEEALWTSEATLRAVTDEAPTLLWRCDPDGALTWHNRRFEEYTHVGASQKGYWQDLVHEDDAAEARSIHAECLASGGPFKAEQRLRAADGLYRRFLVRAQQVFDDAGDLIGWYGSAARMDDTLSEPDSADDMGERFREFSSAAGGMIWSADIASRRIEGLNPAFRSAWALPSDGAIPLQDWIATLHPEDRAQMVGTFDRAAAGESVHGSFRAPAPDGSPRWFHISAFPIADAAGEVRRVGGLLVDVTKTVDRRAYLIDSPDNDELANAIQRDGYRVRRFGRIADFLEIIDDLQPGVVVIGSGAPLEDTQRAAETLKLNAQRMPWIAIGAFSENLGAAVRLMKYGAANVLADTASIEALRTAINAAQADQIGHAPRKPAGDANQRLAQLSTRETEVLRGLVAGATNKEIAISLSLSPRTVETYRAQLMDRLGVRTLAELLKLAAEAAVATPRH
ncbi:MAG: PAS domain-containing protein [Pseudomonadota bacterium]